MSDYADIPYYSYFLNIASATVGTLLIASGLLGFFNPRPFAHYFGIPTLTDETLVFFQAATGRNIGAGIFTWILTLMGKRKTLGIFFLSYRSLVARNRPRAPDSSWLITLGCNMPNLLALASAGVSTGPGNPCTTLNFGFSRERAAPVPAQYRDDAGVLCLIEQWDQLLNGAQTRQKEDVELLPLRFDGFGDLVDSRDERNIGRNEIHPH
ncbi:hypothetical protein DL765_010909 [Monosporascus sp. GIB2]|nr:hypothetical protein DL765_010909 [Monosporascus sp. GIB2]